MPSGPVIGIDLGTTTSCIAVVRDGNARVIPNRGYLTTPSIVAFAQSGRRLVGHAAKRQAITNPEQTIIALKRLTGRRWDSEPVNLALRNVGYKLVEGPHGDVRVELAGTVYSIPELYAMLLEDLKVAAETELGEPIGGAVVTVPAYFNDHQRQATRDAAEIAGIELLAILNEPTAAAIAYGATKKTAKTIVVYDLGGGTFDISIVRVEGDGLFEVLATGGDTFLGGEDFDTAIMDWLAGSFQRETGIDLFQDKLALQRLKDAAEKIKHELSAQDQAEVSLPFIATSGSEALHLTRTMTRDQFEELALPLVERTILLCHHTIEAAGIRLDEVDDVLMVGGSSRIPIVHEKVEEFLQKRPCQGVHPDEAVALGAAFHAHALVNDDARIRLEDVTPHALGFEMPNNGFHVMVPKNTRVPVEKTLTVTTTADFQDHLRFRVWQGESVLADKNELLGEFVFSGLRRAKAREVDVVVTFSLDRDGQVHITAQDAETNLRQSLVITSSSGLTKAEVAQMTEHARATRLLPATQ